jgi:hypothetical protein
MCWQADEQLRSCLQRSLQEVSGGMASALGAAKCLTQTVREQRAVR